MIQFKDQNENIIRQKVQPKGKFVSFFPSDKEIWKFTISISFLIFNPIQIVWCGVPKPLVQQPSTTKAGGTTRTTTAQNGGASPPEGEFL